MRPPPIEVDVEVVEELGADTHVIFAVDAPPVDVDRTAEAAKTRAGAAARRPASFTARVDPHSARVGRAVSLPSTRRASTSSIHPRAYASSVQPLLRWLLGSAAAPSSPRPPLRRPQARRS